MVYTDTNEKVLIERLKQGERSSFDILVSMYQQKGIGIAYNLAGNLEDAKDILQEALIKVYLNIKGFKEESKFSTWFYRIVVNCAWDFLRKRKRMGRFEEPEKELEIADSRFEPAKVAINKELGSNLDNCIAQLPEKQKICFALKHQNGLTVFEIAQILKCRPATVKVHIFRAVRNLQQNLSKYRV